MTNLLIGYPSIPLAGTVTLVSGSADAAFPLANITTGSRANFFRMSAASNLIEIRVDLGASLTRAVDYCFIARANLMKSKGATRALLKGSAADAGYTNIIGSSAALQTRTFTGPRAEDLFFASGFNDQIGGSFPSTAYRYWRFEFGDSVTTGKWDFSKLFFGQLFDFGREPVHPVVVQRAKDKDWERQARYRVKLKWEGVTDTLRNSFISNVLNYRDVSPVVLYDAADYILMGLRTLHCVIIGAEIDVVGKNNSSITVTFDECI